MKNKTICLEFASSLTDICEVNSSFDSGILRVAYEGKNRNGSLITHEAFEKALPTLANVPIVANYNIEDDSIGGHDMGIVKDDEGLLRLINYTEPLGVVTESANQWFGAVEEDDGTIHNYLYTEVLLWKRQPVYNKIKKDGITDHSMEITVKDAHTEDGVFVIDDFEFTALCLLGDDVTPCFESSSLEVFSTDLKKQISEMMQDFKESFTKVDTPNGVEDIHPHKYSMEGGNKVLDDKMKLIAEYGIDVDTLPFSIEDLSVEELKEKFEEMKEAESDPAEPTDDNQDDPDSENFALNEQTVSEICRQLRTETVETIWGEESRYCYMDCDLEIGEVYAYDITDWLMYGFKYTKDGDAISIDFDSKTRKKIAIVDFDGGEQASPVAPVFARAEQAAKDNAEWEARYNTASETIASMETELNELREFKSNVETTADHSAREELFTRFEDLNGVEAFEALREDNAEFDLEALEERLFAIRGRNMAQAKFSAEPQKTPKIKVVKEDMSKDPYGGIVEKYLGKE